ncbi:EboA domain-containing protein [Streptomyces sp. Inha503]|uniref:EboA domain-containing protein n=1 Tax=Streptomyces sp. Inha503 TaxID=3383314 RepID=UPI0039A07DA0
MSLGNAQEVGEARIRALLTDRLTGRAAAWLEAASRKAAADPGALGVLFPQAGLRCGRAPLGTPCSGGGAGQRAVTQALYWTVDDAARTILFAAGAAAEGAGRLAAWLYGNGDAAERRSVLRALGTVASGPQAVGLCAQALSANDLRLVAAALGPYGARHLDAHTWRHGVLKCLHYRVPLRAVGRLEERTDAELIRMARSYARELRSAGRSVPGDLHSLTQGDLIPTAREVPTH